MFDHMFRTVFILLNLLSTAFCRETCEYCLAESRNESIRNWISLERRVRSLEQPVWQISGDREKWLECVQGPCKCQPETRSLSCWHLQINVLPDTQVVPNDVSVIDLGINHLNALNRAAFRTLTHLTEIDLFDNQIDYLPETVFNSLDSLSYLRLNKNLLEDLSNRTFLPLRNLITLDLSDNRIYLLPAQLFAGCSKLTILHLSNNRLQSLSEHLFDGLASLEDLDLNNNFIVRLDRDQFRELSSLRFLKLAENDIEFIATGTFENLYSLELLTLRSNKLTRLSSRLFTNLHNLRELHLTSNLIEQISVLYFANLHALRELHLGQNVIQDVPDGAFERLHMLEKLFLFSNNIERLGSDVFMGLHNLTSLLVNNNLLRVIHQHTLKPIAANLLKLNLDSNKFQYLPDKSLDGLVNLRSIKLAKNPWHCDCNILYLSVWLMDNVNKIWDPQPSCRGPGNLGGASLLGMNFDRLCDGQWASMSMTPRVSIHANESNLTSRNRATGKDHKLDETP